jgi:nucleoside-diphosphate-sugar epimerase
MPEFDGEKSPVKVAPLSNRVPSQDPIRTEAQLDECLSRPTPSLTHFIRSIRSPLLIVGAGGKMGPSLAWLARRAADAAGHPLEIIAASRFTQSRTREWLEERRICTISCDALDPRSVAELPDAQDLLYLVGLKFGTAQNPAVTWASNTLAPAHVCDRFRDARIVALSTGNVYPLTDVSRGGSIEADPLTPLGEYPNAAVARERIFEFFSARHKTPVAILRLYYAVELRYGVLVDIARKVQAQEPLPLANGYINCIWQGDANEQILRALSLVASPPSCWNLCRPEQISVRTIAERFGTLLQREPRFAGTESPTAFLGNSQKVCAALGAPATSVEQMMIWIAQWIQEEGKSWGKPTHFEVRHGVY